MCLILKIRPFSSRQLRFPGTLVSKVIILYLHIIIYILRMSKYKSKRIRWRIAVPRYLVKYIPTTHDIIRILLKYFQWNAYYYNVRLIIILKNIQRYVLDNGINFLYWFITYNFLFRYSLLITIVIPRTNIN